MDGLAWSRLGQRALFWVSVVVNPCDAVFQKVEICVVLSLPWESCRFFFALLRLYLTFLFHFGFFESSTDGKSKQLREPEEFRTVLVLFKLLKQGQVFTRITVTVVTCQETLTVMTVARGQVSFADSYM